MSHPDFSMLTLPDLAQPKIAAAYLGQRLSRGELMLTLGAGVSMSSGLPSWDKLVAECEKEVGIVPEEDRSSRELMQAIDAVRRKLEKQGRGGDLGGLVRRNLYPADLLKAGTYPDEIVERRMLIAVGALAMASSRGSVTDIVTFNFDDLLEWYLELHGFTSQVVPDVPTMLRGDRDVIVYHPHGFLPLVEKRYRPTQWLVLSHSELVERLTGVSSKWPTVLEGQLMGKVMLAVGTSMSDLDLQVILRRVQSEVAGRPLGFVVVKELEADERDDLMEKGLVPVEVGSYDAVPDFLLEICRRAADLR